jgi:peptide deformylase
MACRSAESSIISTKARWPRHFGLAARSADFLDGIAANSYFDAMAIRQIIETPDPLLRQISTPVESVDDELRALIDDMFETMYAAPGIGLAAIQVGVPKRLLVIDLQEPKDGEGEGEGEEAEEGEPEPVRDPRVFINPEILETSDTLKIYNEGCLSVPEQFAEIERPDRIRARWLDADGKQHEEVIEGLLAVCLQHEIDHLEGILFIDHLSRLKRDMILKKIAKAKKDQPKKAA